MRPLRTVTLAGIAAGAYSVVEGRSYRLGRVEVPVGDGSPPLRILHLSDTHLSGLTPDLHRWLGGLPEAVGEVDLIVATGDLIDDDAGIDMAVDALGRFEARLGRYYVLGSHDYFQSTIRGLMAGLSTLYAARRSPETSRPADTARLEGGLKESGWISLGNAVETVNTPNGTVRLAGVDDPFLKRHETDHIRRGSSDAFAVAMVHCPDIVSECVLRGFDLILAGHTHGGQVRVPGFGALVTNCTLPPGLARGLSRVGSSYLHLSPGLGTSRFAPIRFFCPPEATVLEVKPG
jgi:uncharacterized protein